MLRATQDGSDHGLVRGACQHAGAVANLHRGRGASSPSLLRGTAFGALGCRKGVLGAAAEVRESGAALAALAREVLCQAPYGPAGFLQSGPARGEAALGGALDRADMCKKLLRELLVQARYLLKNLRGELPELVLRERLSSGGGRRLLHTLPLGQLLGQPGDVTLRAVRDRLSPVQRHTEEAELLVVRSPCSGPRRGGGCEIAARDLQRPDARFQRGARRLGPVAARPPKLLHLALHRLQALPRDTAPGLLQARALLRLRALELELRGQALDLTPQL
mmetsp:Transcript_47715/g.150022  ORF Transcript_47715/g.150022 Transcript_47715/m.150022 type:complete len:277 (-) Transcript_47715:894-1724(-)